MKKILYAFILLSFMCIQSVWADDLNNFVLKYAAAPNAEKQVVDSTMMSPGSAYDWSDRIPLEGAIDSLIITNLTKCSPDIKNQFILDFQGLVDNNEFDTVVNLNSQGDIVRVVARKGYNFIREVYVFAVDQSQNAIILKIVGKITEIDPQKFISASIE